VLILFYDILICEKATEFHLVKTILSSELFNDAVSDRGYILGVTSYSNLTVGGNSREPCLYSLVKCTVATLLSAGGNAANAFC
jgi:hypothetical protein